MSAAVQTQTPRERPVILRDHEARGLADGSISVLWREVKPQPPSEPLAVERYAPIITNRRGEMDAGPDVFGAHGEDWDRTCPYGAPGDRLWVRETWGLCRFGDATDWYRGKVGPTREGDPLRQANGVEYRAEWGPQQEHCFWRPSIHMPRWACRTVLEIVSVGVQRPQDASEGVANASLPPLAAGPRRQASADLVATLVEHGVASTTWCWTLTVRRLP